MIIVGKKAKCNKIMRQQLKIVQKITNIRIQLRMGSLQNPQLWAIFPHQLQRTIALFSKKNLILFFLGLPARHLTLGGRTGSLPTPWIFVNWPMLPIGHTSFLYKRTKFETR